MLKRLLLLSIAPLFLVSCISTKSTIKNIDNTAARLKVVDDAYQITETADNAKYGIDEDFPVNIGFIMEANESKFASYYFNALTGPNGEKLSYNKIDTCCPFPTKNTKVGAGTLSIYEVTWEGQSKPLRMYFNFFERGKIMCPKGLSIKNKTP